MALAAELAASHGCRIVVATAYADWVVERAGRPAFVADVVHKPYSPEDMLAALTRTLAG